MPLSFECQQDFRKMKNTGGKKYCEVCNKNVHDVRNKSFEKINDLVKNGEACLIIYESQLKKLDEIKNSVQLTNKKEISFLPYAAGIAALSLLPQLAVAQESTKEKELVKKEIKAFEQLEITLVNTSGNAVGEGKEVELYINDKKLFTQKTDNSGSVSFTVSGDDVQKIKIRVTETNEFRIIENSGKFLSRCIRFESTINDNQKVIQSEQTKYVIKGKLIFSDKKFKLKAGQTISVYKNSDIEDSLIDQFKVGVGGKFHFDVSENVYKLLQEDENQYYFKVGERYARYEIIKTENNIIHLNLYKRVRRARMGKW
jgi:hypothetical protein